MVRSKFPGKPSKIVNRKIVNSSKYTLQHENESTKAAENISYGLAVFNEVFGDNDQALTAFHGFSPHEIDRAHDIAKKQREKVLIEYSSSGMIHKPEDAIPIKLDPPTPQVLSQMEAKLDLIGPVGRHSTRAQCNSLISDIPTDYSKPISPSKYFSPFKGNLKKHVANRLLQRAKRSSLDGSSINRMRLNTQFEKSGPSSTSSVLRKFVLPSHSVRSSRVIKPNKRFLDSEESVKDGPSHSIQTDSSLRSRTIELKKPRLILDTSSDFHSLRSVEVKCNTSDISFTPLDGNVSLTQIVTNNGTKGKQQWKHVKLGELNVFGAPTTQPSGSRSCKNLHMQEDTILPQKTVTSTKPSPISEDRSSKSKLMLRESKLSISTSAETLQEGMFCRKPKKGIAAKTPSSPVECEVCGAVRVYRLAKQAHKFGINSCEPCRKFVARMIIRARSSENSVSCEKGQGNCAMMFNSNENESITNKIHKCSACWLLMCIQRYVSMPEQTRDSLIRMLPANMQGMTVIVPTTSPCNKGSLSKKQKRTKTQHINKSSSESPLGLRQLSPGSKKKSQTAVSRIRRKAALVSLTNNLRRAREKTVSTPQDTKRKSVSVSDRSDKGVKKIGCMKKSRPLPKTSEKPGRKAAIKGLEKGKDGSLRQKLTLKGPRVKHVCRSASIVLGQPFATFPLKSAVPLISPSASTFQSNTGSTVEHHASSDLSKCKLLAESHEPQTKTDHHEMNSATSEIVVTKDSCSDHLASQLTSSEAEKKGALRAASNSSVSQAVTGRRISGVSLNSLSGLAAGVPRGQRRTLQALGVYNTQIDSVPELVSLDFWESYDPDEVCNSGFGLIGFEPFSFKPLCFLCGSAGKQKLIHCASCCEPYHQFCVEMGVLGNAVPPAFSENPGREEWRLDWVCPRCTVCHGCGRSSGHQLTSCQRCHNFYHIECLGSTSLRKNTGDRVWICSSCLRCKSCNSATVTKFVGNLPFCKICFKLRQKGNFCPLCQGCYTDDDYQSKMMECAECKAWVHAKCEGLSDEKYQVLSYLPESVEYVCRLCCAFPPAPWWQAVEAELQAGYINVIKAITKNRKACAMLKWSPKKTCSCHQSSASTVTKIPNSGAFLGKRKLSFNHKEKETELKIPPPNFTRTSQQASDMAVFDKFKTNSSIFEFDDDIDAGENAPITKYVNARVRYKSESIPPEYPILQLECLNEMSDHTSKCAQYSPNASSQSDSGIGSTDDELKTCSAAEEEDVEEKKVTSDNVLSSSECLCSNSNPRYIAPSLLTVRKKVHSSEYSSLLEFHQDMDQLISEADSHEVKELYHQTLQEVFPWFDPKYTRVSRNSLPSSPCKPYHGSLLQHQQGSSPEKNSGNLSSMKTLKNLIPKDVDMMDDSYFYCGFNVKDDRICCFCKLCGDSAPNDEGRLLYCGQNDWVHVNCALWSAEVFEEIDGALQNVSNALSRGRMIRCSECGKKGASVGCCAKKCEETLHFPCARKAGFVFMEDKNVFCPLHKKDAPGKPLVKPSDFDICRPVFVELDRRKKKSIQSKHVRVVIGSLFVESLGTIVPEVSDQGSVIIPTQFNCTRLFWSSKEPWRIVQYSIRTTVHLPAPEPVLDFGHHVTVDHSKDINTPPNGSGQKTDGVHCSKASLQTKSSEMANPKSACVPSGLSSGLDETKVVEAVVNHLLDAVCSKEVDEEVSDAQNSADLLPPELKDAIFEDLPHDFLDGISMQDIFQDKFLSFEDVGKEDVPEERNGSGAGVGCAKEQSLKEKSKFVRSLKAARQLQRSKSDVLPSSSSQTADRLHQRSCSLAWSCKLGTTLSCCKAPKGRSSEDIVDRTRLIQELRLSVKPAPSVGRKYSLQDAGDKGKENHTVSWPRIMQVDGVCDTSASESSDGEDNVIDGTSNIISDFKCTLLAKDSELFESRVDLPQKRTSATLYEIPEIVSTSMLPKQPCLKYACNRRRIFGKGLICKKKWLNHELNDFGIPQFDGAADLSSDSEHDVASDVLSTMKHDEKPVRCDRCRCTYRTSESYARHLPSCSGDYSLTTSESEADVSEDEAGCNKKHAPVLELSLAPSPDSAISVSSGSVVNVPAISPTSSVAPPPLPVTSSVTSAPSILTNTLPVLGQTGPLLKPSDSPIILVEQVPSSPSVSSAGNLASTFTGVSDCTVKFKSQMSQEPSRGQTVEVLLNANQPVIQELANQSSVPQTLQQPPPQQPSVIMLDYPHSQQSGPTVLVQSVPSAAMVPTFLEAYQQHSGHNLQYLTTVDTSGGFGKTQFLTAVPSTVVPGAYQLQAVPDGQLCVDPCTMGISTLPGIQLAQAQLPPPQPQVLGTLLQSSLPCGVVATAEPVYETIQMYPDQAGGVLLTSQPMLTCMETVVSNTYMSMSSSQFVSSSVPGMLEGSSTFSTTTTQVFQAGEVDPPVIDVPTQFVMVNPQATSGREIEVVPMNQRKMQDQSAGQTRSQIQIPSINLPIPAQLPAPIPPQTLPPVIPTSVVPPMPRIQPQRTYSKPTKANKEVQANGNGGCSSTNPLKPNIIRPSKDRNLLQLNSGSVRDTSATQECQTRPTQHPVSKQRSVSKNSAVEPSSKHRGALKSLELPTEPAPSPSEFIATNIAPAQSITLPDPIPKLIVDEGHATDVLSGRTVGASGRCPPITFSYRPIGSKPNQKRGSPQLIPTSTSDSSSLQSSCIALVKCQSVSGDNKCVKLDTDQVKPSFPHSLSTSTHGSVVSANDTSKTSKESVDSRISPVTFDSRPISTVGNGKPIATIIPQTQARLHAASSNHSISESCDVISVPGPVTSSIMSGSKTCGVAVSKASTSSCASIIRTYSAIANQSDCTSVLNSSGASPTICSIGLSCPPGHACCSNPLLASLIANRPHNAPTPLVPCEAVTANSTTSQTSSTTGTSATFSCLKSATNTGTSLKPLQEIKTANLKNVEGNSSPSRNQDKLLISVPPTVLKAASHSYDLSIKTDLFSKQGDVPVIYANGEKSPTSLKLLFQKQAHNGCYKVSSSPGGKEDDVTLVTFADANILSLNHKKAGKDESENVQPVSKASKKAQSNSTLPQLMYEIRGQDGFSYSSTSMSDMWQKVFDAVQEARAKHKMPPLLHNPFGSSESSPNLFGLGNNSLKYIMEQLRRIEDCTKYRPIYHKSRLPGPGYRREDLESNLKESSSGCARTDPCMSLKKYDMFSWLDSRHRCPPKLLESSDLESFSGGRRSTSTNLPMAMRFRHLRETSKTSVGVFRSDIHGRGLFCLRDIEAGEMVIEYAGEVIRNTLTDNRERYYQSKGIDCYMFKVDDNFTVDATRKGNAARFINHSCEPNCYSRVVDIHGKKHIIIFAYRRIPQGEELTYDYKFPIEDVKIACHCLAPRCRKYLN